MKKSPRALRQQSKRKEKNATSEFYHYIFTVALVALIASIVVYLMCFPKPVKQSLSEKLEITQKESKKIMQRKVLGRNNTESQLTFIDDVYVSMEKGLSSAMIDNGIVEILLNLVNSTNSTIQYEATKTMIRFMKNGTNYPEIFVQKGIVPPFLQLIHSKNEETANMALMGFFFMLQEKSELTNTVFKMGLDKHLVELISSLNSSSEIFNTALTILMNACNNENPSISLESVAVILPAFSKLLLHSDIEVVESTYVALYCLTRNTNLRHQLKFDNEMIKIFMNQINHENPKVQTFTLSILMNVVNDQSPINLDDEMLKQLPNLLMNDKNMAVKIGLNLILKYIIAKPNQSYVFFKANLLQFITDKLTVNNLFIKKQAVAVIYLFVSNGPKQHISTLLNMQIIPKLYNILLETTDDETKQMILNTFNLLVQLGDIDFIYNDFEKVDAFKELVKFSKHSNGQIRNFSRQILEAINFKKSIK